MVDKVICKICGHEAKMSLQSHINYKHGMSKNEYQNQYKEAPIWSNSYLNKHKKSMSDLAKDPMWKKKVSDGVKNLWKNPDYKKCHCEALKIAQNMPETKKRHSEGALRYFSNRTPEQKKAHVESLKKAWRDPQKRKNRVKILRDSHQRSEARKNHSESIKKYYKGLKEEERLAIRNNLKKIWAKPENRKKILELSKIGLAKANTPEARLKITNQTAETKAKRSRVAQKRLMNQPVISSLNKLFKEALNNNDLWPLPEQTVGPYCVDFLFKEKRVIVEVDGDYWHANPILYDYSKLGDIQKRVVRKDKAEVSYCNNHDWTLLRFWEYDIKKDIDVCIKKVQEALNE